MTTNSITIQFGGPNRVKFGPFGSMLYGRDYFEAAETSRVRERSLVPYFLYSQAIELGLKAFLIWKGMSIDDLRTSPYGHHLKNLLNHAKTLALDTHVSLSTEEVVAIEKARDFYDSGNAKRRFQYFDVSLALSHKGLPNRADLAAAARKLVTDHTLEDEYVKFA